MSVSEAELTQDLSHVHTTDELNVFANQLDQNGFAFRTHRRQAPQVNDQFAGLKIGSGGLVGAGELSGPRYDKFALYDHAALAWALDNRDLQHDACFLDVRERNPRSRHRRLQLLGFQ